MRAAIAALFATMIAAHAAQADVIDDEARQLGSAPGYKRRLAAVLVLAKSHDARAVRALATSLRRDKEVQIRRVSALGLSKAVDATTPIAARDLAFTALADAAASDKDAKVRTLSTRTLEELAPLKRPKGARDLPPVYVHLATGADLSSQAPRDALPKLVRAVKSIVAQKTPGASTDWPGAAPTERELSDAGSRGFLVAPTISALAVVKRGRQAEVACTVSVRVAPWSGTDGSEKWTAQHAASASGSGKAITTADPAGIAGGMRDCVLAVAEEVTAKQVVPFLRKLIGGA